MKILNLFAGIGGNRTLWGSDHEITAIEWNQKIAMIYLKRFPNDRVIVGDAYKYLEEHFLEFDFIWASPPCTSHTRMMHIIVSHKKKGRNWTTHLPDLRLYSIILFLNNFFEGNWIVENVKGYYEPLIKPTSMVGRHYIWTNYKIPKKNTLKGLTIHLTREEFKENINKALIKKQIPPQIYELFENLDVMIKKQIINNCILPKEGKYILDSINTKTLDSYL